MTAPPANAPRRGLRWFARHEIRLAIRDLLAMLQGSRHRAAWALAIIIVASIIMHLIAYVIVHPLSPALTQLGKSTAVTIGSAAFLSWTLMLSQAMEAATRSFYARGDLDLILSSPFAGRHVFVVRLGAIFITTLCMALVVIGAFIDVSAWLAGPRFLAAYAVLAAMAMLATATAATSTAVLFQLAGPGRTRFLSQILSAIVGAGFVIAIQAAAVMSYNSLSTVKILTSSRWIEAAPDLTSPIWLPVLAATGDGRALAIVLGGATLVFASAVWIVAGLFARNALLVAANPARNIDRRRTARSLSVQSPRRTLLVKEWRLLLRDPWLLSQSLMQILYLLPPALLLRQSFHGESSVLLLAPVITLAAGQLAGGLAWLAISAEDAPDLIASAPVKERTILIAKIQAVLLAVAAPVTPFIAVMAWIAPRVAIATAVMVCIACSASCCVQFLFREQAKRSRFRRRQTSSRIATFAEALISTLMAATAALWANHMRFAAAPAILAIFLLATIAAFRRRSL